VTVTFEIPVVGRPETEIFEGYGVAGAPGFGDPPGGFVAGIVMAVVFEKAANGKGGDPILGLQPPSDIGFPRNPTEGEARKEKLDETSV
jgi:hypothetical protein